MLLHFLGEIAVSVSCLLGICRQDVFDHPLFKMNSLGHVT